MLVGVCGSDWDWGVLDYYINDDNIPKMDVSPQHTQNLVLRWNWLLLDTVSLTIHAITEHAELASYADMHNQILTITPCYIILFNQ